MSTIERALEKQRKLAEERRKSQEQRIADALGVDGNKTTSPNQGVVEEDLQNAQSAAAPQTRSKVHKKSETPPSVSQTLTESTTFPTPKPKTLVKKTEPTARTKQAETTRTEATSTANQPETTHTEPKSPAKRPEATRTEPATTAKQPDPKRTEQATPAKHPDAMRTEPATTAKQSEATRTEPATTAKQSETAITKPTTGSHKPELAPNNKGVININIQRLERMGFITPTENFSRIKEEYRYIKRPLLNNAFGGAASTLKNPNLIMVSSSYSGEGKTFTAINLAISMALEQDRNVLLIDADVVHPHICERLGIPEVDHGLMDFLVGQARMEEIISDTSIPKLKLVGAGTHHHHASEMLASSKMVRLMHELSTRYCDRVVIFDTSPLLGASETHVLSQHAGQAVVVVEEARTTHQQVEQAIKLLNPEIAINLVLNKSNAGRGEYQGYYYANS